MQASVETLFGNSPLTVAGKVILSEGEVEIKVVGDSQFLLHDHNKRVTCELFPSGSVVLTNTRLLAIYDSYGGALTCRDILLCKVLEIEDCSTFLKRSQRLNITLEQSHLGIRFGKNNREKDEFLSLFKLQLVKRSWEQKESITVSSATVQMFSISNAGVGGLLRRQEQSLKSAESLTKDALADLNSLMKSAKDVVMLVERYATATKDREQDNDSDTSSQLGERNEVESILQSIGMISPVTKYTAGRLYHRELSRQLADLLLTDNRIMRMGGIINLIDSYCLFNRARGMELVSPDDFRRACNLLDSLHVGLECKIFASGVVAICCESMNDDTVCEQLLSFTVEPELALAGLDVSTVASRLHMSLVVAKEQLLLAEKAGFLCRDETINGLFFFPNKFDEFVDTL